MWKRVWWAVLLLFPHVSDLRFPRVAGIDRYLDKAGEKPAGKAKAKRKTPARKEAASSVPKKTLPGPVPVPLDGVAEMLQPPDTAPAEVGSLSGDGYPTPQPDDAHHTKSYSQKKKKGQREGQEVAKLQQLSGPPLDNVNPVAEQDDTKADSSNLPGDGPNPPKREIIDLTVKEESRPATPIPPAQGPESNEGPTGLKAGWVRFSGILYFNAP